MTATSTTTDNAGIPPEPRSSTSPTEVPPSPSRRALVRGAAVVVGGPVLLNLLELLAPVSVLVRWPQSIPDSRLRRAARWLTAVGVLAPALDHGLVRPWLRGWGATRDERVRRMPGDPENWPLMQATRAVNVSAPAHEVWQWLVQIGQDRGGFYSYDWLENLAGCRIHSAEKIHEEWQYRQAGDALTVFPGYATTVIEVRPPYDMVIEHWGAFIVEPVDNSTCRLLARSNAGRDGAGLLYVCLLELPHAIMERKMLLGIKGRAERHQRLVDRP